MKNFLIILIIIILGIVTYRYLIPSPAVEAPIEFTKSGEEDFVAIETTPSIIGCYVAGTDQDVYILIINNQEGENVTGSLEFDNYQKDSSRGSFKGTYQSGILLGDYSFNSEGMNSVMEVIFKQEGENFVRGYGEVNEEGTEFINTQDIEFKIDDLSLFEKELCT